jgi:cobalt-zinc-cadmium efflux system membrane fusion protein
MKRRTVLSGLILVITGCGTGPEKTVEATVEKEPAQREEARPANEVLLSEAERAGAGIESRPIVLRPGRETIQATGRLTVNEDRTWRVGAITEGRVTRVDARAGDRVQAGQILAYLHTHDVHEARAEYQKAMSERARLGSQANHAIRVRDRSRTLYELKAGSLEAYEHAEAEVKNVQQMIVQAEAEIERVRTHLVEFLGVKLEEPEQHRPGEHDTEDWVPVRTPSAGVVIERNASVGTVVPAAGQLFVVTDPTSVWMIAAVHEDYFAHVRSGMAVTVRVQAHPEREFRGRITRIGEALDPATRTVQARIELANPGGMLKPEMFATAELQLPGERQILMAPEAALQELKGQSVVFVDRGQGRFEAAPVELGVRLRGEVEIRGGLQPGDRVVVRGAFVVKSQLLKSSLAEE